MPKQDPLKADKRLLDKTWRVSHLYKITTKDNKLIQFKPNRAQEHFQQNRHTRNIILKSRQLGFTTFEAIDTLDDVLFNKNFEALFIAHDLESALKIFDGKVQFAWNHYPLAPLYKVDTDRANMLKFNFGDKTQSSISVKTSGRSGTYHRVHISEFAKKCKEDPAKAKEILTGTIPAIPLGGRVDIESTAEGETGDFYDLFWEAWNRGNPTKPVEFKAHFYNWTWDDDEISKVTPETNLPTDFIEYQKKFNLSDLEITYYFYKWLSLNKDWTKLRQEYPTTPEEAFATSGFKLFNTEKLEKQTFQEGLKEGDWIYYENYNPTHRYGIGADVGEGIGQDSSTGVVWDFTLNSVVAEYASNHIAPDMFAFELRNAGHRYGTCLIGVERNNHGFATLSKLKEIYPLSFIYKEIKKDRDQDRSTERLGWHTTAASKPQLMYDLSLALDQEQIKIPSKHIAWEMRTFDRAELTKDANETKHWDRLIATAIGWQMRYYATNSNFSLYRDREMVSEARFNRQSNE